MTPIYDTDELIYCSYCPCDAQVWVAIDNGETIPMCLDCAES